MSVADLELLLGTTGRLDARVRERSGGAGRGEEEQARGESAHDEILRRGAPSRKLWTNFRDADPLLRVPRLRAESVGSSAELDPIAALHRMNLERHLGQHQHRAGRPELAATFGD